MIIIENPKKGLFKNKKDEAWLCQEVIRLMLSNGYTGNVATK